MILEKQLVGPRPPWVIYLLSCRGNKLYAGITNDLKKRYAAHLSGRGAKFTRANPPERIVATRRCATKSEALKLEYALKQQPAFRKIDFLGAAR